MALTTTIEGLGIIANADLETNDTGGTGTGDWGFTGSGGVSNGATTDTFYFGDTSISMALSGAGKNGWLYFDRGAGNEIDFDVAGTEEGEHIYIWVHCPTLGLSETLANVGLGIRVGNTLTDHRTFTVAGNDDSNGWDGAWKCFVIDPTKTGSITDTGTYDAGAVRYIGIKGETTATAKGDNFFVSQIAVGSGLRVTGTSTNGWEELVDYCTDLPNRAFGMMQQREGIYYAYGGINIGDTAQSAATSFVDSGRVIQFGISEYYISAAWETSADIDYHFINVEDHASWTTTFTDGVVVGSDNGRSGSTILGNLNHNVAMDLYAGLNAGSLTALYGTTLTGLTGALNSGNDGDHKFYAVSFIGCAQFDPVGAPIIRNCVFSELRDDGTADASNDSALLWNDNIDIEDCSFIANSHGTSDVAHGIEHDSITGDAVGTVTTADATGITLNDTTGAFLTTVAVNDIVFNETDGSSATVTSITSDIALICDGLTGGTDDEFASSDAYSVVTPITYTNLVFSGNEIDVHNNKASSNGLAISKSGTSNPTTATNEVKYISSVPLKWTVIDKNAVVIAGAQVSAFLKSDDSPIMSPTDTNVSGIVSTSYAQSTPVDIYYRVRKSSTGSTKYVLFSAFGTISTGGLDVTVTLTEDTNNNT